MTNEDVTLDAAGNITWKLGVGSFAYSGVQSGCTYGHAHVQPRAVRNAGGTVYCYDANGNMTKRAGETITYASYNLPTLINAPGNSSSALSYGAFRNRYKQVAASGGTSETTIYVAGLLEKVSRPSQPTEYRHVIRGGNGAAAIHVRRTDSTSDTYYLHRDHLGSPELITGNDGSVVVRASFSAYGERRDDDHDGAIPAGELAALANVTHRGFTGHEHLDAVGLIHMNGRVYEPRIGRFLGADPIVVAGASQGANPYAYVWNNPLRYTDPSGFCTDAVDCYNTGFAPIIGGGLWNLALNRRMFQEPRVPSASPASAPYESPGMVLPKEGRATFSPLRILLDIAANQPGAIIRAIVWIKEYDAVFDATNGVEDVLLPTTDAEIRPYDTSARGYHRYVVLSEICQVKDTNCTESAVFEQVRRYPAPGRESTSKVRTRERSRLFGTDPVVFEVDDKNRIVVNSTLPGHAFEDGQVIREVVRIGEKIYVRTIGHGVNRSVVHKAANIWGGQALFRDLDKRIRDAVNGGN